LLSTEEARVTTNILIISSLFNVTYVFKVSATLHHVFSLQMRFDDRLNRIETDKRICCSVKQKLDHLVTLQTTV